MAEDETVVIIKKDFIRSLASKGKRIDGRKFDEYRPIALQTGFIGSAEGSARVRIGRSDVVAGIKMDFGTPFPDRPDLGVMMTNAEMGPIASPSFEAGPPRPASIELARVIDRGIRESNCIPLDSLCITPSEKVWMVFIDLHVLDFDGNLFDTGALAAICALRSTMVPLASKDLGEDYPLKLNNFPVSVTSTKVGETVLVDPSLDEELVADARLTVSSDEKSIIRAMQKGLEGAFTPREVKDIVRASIGHAGTIRAQVKEFEMTSSEKA